MCKLSLIIAIAKSYCMVFLLLKKETVIERSFILVNSQTGNIFRLPILSEACGFMHFLQHVNCFLKVYLLISSVYSNPRDTAFLI